MAKKQRGKGEGGLYKRADGMWCVSVELPRGLDGRRRRKVICRKSKADANSVLREAQDTLKKQGDIVSEGITLEKWLRHWLDDIASQKVRPKTLAGHRTVAEGYIIPLLGRKRIDKLTAQDVRTLQQTMQRTPKDPALRNVPAEDLPPGTVMLSSTYTLLAHNVLSGALKTALRERRIDANPCEMVDRPQARNAEQKALDVNQSVRLLQYLMGLDGGGALWATYLLSGARRGEILGLEADRVTDHLDLSWQLQRITDISKAPANWEYRELGGTLYLSRPKSKKGWRIIPLVEPLRSILALHMGNQKEGLVFTRGGAPWDPDAASKAWKQILKDAGLPTDVVLHGSRHTTVDLLYQAGVGEATIMEIVGHSSRAVTRGYKSRGNRPQLEAGMEKMSALLRGEN